MRLPTSGPRAPFRSARAASLGILLATGGAALLSGCGQTPGETGLSYLEAQGVRVSAPLYHLTLDSLPLDSVFAVETPYNHFGESLLVVGRDENYTARTRLGFQITTQAQRDSLASGLHLRLSALRLSSSFPATSFPGEAWLRASSAGRDSITLLVESFSWPNDSGKRQFTDSISAFHRRIIVTPVPFSTLDSQYRRRDTIRVYPKLAYPADSTGASSQAGALPNLHQRLLTGHGGDSTRNWIVYLEISPLTTADSGLFHFYTQAVGNSAIARSSYSGLWLGHYAPDSLLTSGSLLMPYRSGALSAPASNYDARHDGVSTRSLLHGVARGLHLRINRDTLLERIRTKLNARDPGNPTLGDRLLASAPSGNAFDRRFYVPYARLLLPIDTALTRVQGPFAIDMGLTSDVDSLDTDTAPFNDDIFVLTGATANLPVQGPGSASDELVVSYRAHPVDTTLRQILYHWASSPSAADTLTVIPNGLRRELAARRKTGWPRATTVGVRPQAGQLNVEVFFSVASAIEPNGFLDSNGNALTSTSTLSARFWRPGADTLDMRATRGVRNLLNRVHEAGKGSVPDMLLQSVRRAAYQVSVDSLNVASYQKVSFPVLGEIDFKRGAGGKLYVGLDLYLYPLEARP